MTREPEQPPEPQWQADGAHGDYSSVFPGQGQYNLSNPCKFRGLCGSARAGHVSVLFKVLNSALVGLCRLPGAKCPEIPPSAGFWVLLARVQAVLARAQFPNHRDLLRHRGRTI